VPDPAPRALRSPVARATSRAPRHLRRSGYPARYLEQSRLDQDEQIARAGLDGLT